MITGMQYAGFALQRFLKLISMKKKTHVYASFVHDGCSATKVYPTSQKTLAKLTVTSDVTACKSLMITVGNETVIPVIHAGNLINRS